MMTGHQVSVLYKSSFCDLKTVEQLKSLYFSHLCVFFFLGGGGGGGNPHSVITHTNKQ